jgi:hypothetical protein
LKIVESADTLLPPHPFAAMREKVINLVHKQWVKHAAIDAINSVLFFSLDELYQQVSPDAKRSAMDWFLQWGVQFLVHYKQHRFTSAPPATHLASVEAELTSQYADFKSGQGGFLLFRHRLSLKGNPKQTWELYSDTEIAICVLALFNVTASEAAVERSFSRQGLIHSKLRNRLADSSVKQSMRFSFNTRALDLPLKPEHGLCMELADDDVAAVEEGNGMDLLGFGLEHEEVAAGDSVADSEVDSGEEQVTPYELEESNEEQSREAHNEEAHNEGKDERGEVEEQRAVEQVREPPVSKKRRVPRDAAADELQERKRKSAERRSAQSPSMSVEALISEWIEEHGGAWNKQLRIVLEGRLLTYDIPITVAVVEGMLKQRVSELFGQSCG